LNKTFIFNSGILDKIDANVNYTGVGEHYWSLDNSIYEDYYGLLDAKLSFTSGKFQFDIWAKNILNTSYNSYYFEISALKNAYAQKGNPATFGANLKINL
jgi:hypothetical protein